MSKQQRDLLGTLCAVGALLSVALFILDGLFFHSRALGLLAALCLLPVSIAILGAFLHQLAGFLRETRR